MAIVNREGRIFWFEHERCTVAKANDAFDRFKLDHMKVDFALLPRHVDPYTKLYGRVDLDSCAPMMSYPEIEGIDEQQQGQKKIEA